MISFLFFFFHLNALIKHFVNDGNRRFICYEGLRWDLDGVTGVMRLEKAWLSGLGMGLVVYCLSLSLSLSLYFMMCFLVSLLFSFSLCSSTVFLWQ